MLQSLLAPYDITGCEPFLSCLSDVVEHVDVQESAPHTEAAKCSAPNPSPADSGPEDTAPTVPLGVYCHLFSTLMFFFFDAISSIPVQLSSIFPFHSADDNAFEVAEDEEDSGVPLAQPNPPSSGIVVSREEAEKGERTVVA